MSQIKIGVLISGGGTNLQSIIDAVNNGQINASIEVVISNKSNAYGLERAKKNDIDALFINSKEYKDITEFNDEIIKQLKLRDVDLVVLAGYLKILTPEFISEYKNRIINIHPSLIPSFCGGGYYGERVHNAVLEKGVKVTGATVHFVDEGTDTGPIILQDVVKIDDDESLDSLKKKVLNIEHKILVKAIKLYCDDKLIIKNNKAIMKG
ncbi:phosphoribosylglycinamide formyltransferase [Abyssisolibacter fermentans]|uniref:phosphoribosylglycinamide formyltransferase n=1 Tax=Abyssisolibacter fermentans TaxID=1766203 RepID=UPI0008311EC3|nr:phosphoribosylglycinamide formyltransferase [Abyssisolibacter fermentans]